MNLFDFFNFFSPARSEIAENGADKVLSSEEKNSSVHRAYVNFSTSRKSALDVPLYAISSGRSMVEMLGVLAIIGVLSVGAMSGYSKAMFKYKLNKQTEQTNTIISALFRYQTELRLSPHTADSLQQTELIPILKKLNEIPPEMFITNNDTYVNDVFNTQCHAYHRTDNRAGNKNEYIAYRCTLEREEYGFEICQNLYNIAKEWRQDINSVATVAYQGDDYDKTATYYGDKFCFGNRNCLKDLKLDDLDQICRVEKNSDHYSIQIVIADSAS